MSGSFTAACLQLTSDREVEANIAAVRELARRARDKGADLVMTPEVTDMMEPKRALAVAKAKDEANHPMLAAARDVAREIGAWFLLGSIVVKLADDERTANRSFLIAPDGVVRARYDKIHMFDVTLPDGRAIRESSAYRPGDRAVLARTPWGALGMTVCYDLRFPGLYRALAQAGAEFLAVPSSFTAQTGPAHWHTLLRARAIENTCFVFAPAMCGEHPGNRSTYGHSLMIGPWGDVLAEGGDQPGIVMARIDRGAIAKARGMIPSLEHDRPYRVECV